MLHFRFATIEDVPLILQFIKELAEYEQLLQEVAATEKILKESLFGKKKYAEIIFASYYDQIAGFALFFHNFSTFTGRPGIYLENLYVKKQFRGEGIGKALLEELAKLCKKRNCPRLEWWVLDWNEKAIGFYKKLGASPVNGLTVFRLTGPELTKLIEED